VSILKETQGDRWYKDICARAPLVSWRDGGKVEALIVCTACLNEYRVMCTGVQDVLDAYQKDTFVHCPHCSSNRVTSIATHSGGVFNFLCMIKGMPYVK
jgi:DNA-directed RNA polymerase subunit RPC12/RpoP